MSDKQTPNYYETLHLASSASDADIRRQYRLLSKQFHPDMGGSHEDMAKINEAYGVLSDQFRRTIYDAERRRALHVPPRAPAQSVYTPPRRQPAPRSQAYAATKPHKRRLSWWTALAWGFAALVVTVGILMQLPLAEANGGAPKPTTTAQPLAVSYPPESAATTQTPTFYAAPDGTSYGAPAETPNTQSTQQNTTCSNSDCYSTSTCSGENCTPQQTQSKKNCVTRTFGLYKHTVCSAPSGSNNCVNDTVGTSRYTTCD